MLLVAAFAAPAWAGTRIVAFGDSLSAGYELKAGDAFPAVLERALRRDGFDVSVDDAAVSGDTTQGGSDRVDWSVPDGTALAIVELGANDMLRGIDPAITAKNLSDIVADLKKRHIAVLMAGMIAAPELDPAYRARFSAVYTDIAKRDGVALYPFFLGPIIGHGEFHLSDGMHPNPAGVEAIVRGILPAVEGELGRLGVNPAAKG